MSTIKITPVSYNLWSQDKASFAKAFGESFLETGFAVVSDHTISADAIQSAAEQTKAFFAFPRDQKTRYADPENGHQRGYSPIGSENAKGRTVSDFKEFWHTGRDLPKDSPYRTNMQDTPQVAELPDFNIATRDLYEALDDFGVDLLRVKLISMTRSIMETPFCVCCIIRRKIILHRKGLFGRPRMRT